MDIHSIKHSVAGMPDRIHNYDVLLLQNANGEPLRFAPGNHVGNQRFLVLLSLFRQRYLQADLFGHKYDCLSIAQEVFETVCHKCVPNGRFFEKVRDNRWKQSRHAIIIDIIMNALKDDAIDTHSLERSPKRVCPRCKGFELPCKIKPSTSFESDESVASPNPFDIVCEANGLSRLHMATGRRHTGNNRLKILFGIRKKNYEISDQEGRQRIIEELVSSIIDYASSHFLQFDKLSGMYTQVSRESAIECVQIALDASIAGEEQQFGQSEVKTMVQRKHKKAALDRLENRKGKRFSLSLFYPSLPSTIFRGSTPKAA
mmetsp:Transcript_21624/g.38737  ORF Transcript_21624/g.38737 Transcript_21624/m.38737 type:complete len:316 (+) Transcript_21624:231-1178(+)